MKRQGGFTLIELVVVIVILGILAVTAAPRFLDLQSDARESALNGMKGAMQGASGIVFGKAAVDGLDTTASTADPAPSVDGSGETVTINFGYPTANDGGMGNAVSGIGGTGADNTDDWVGAETATDSGIYRVTFNNVGTAQDAASIANGECYVEYQNNLNATGEPTYTVVTDGC